MTTYTNISKPSGTSYTNFNAVGKQQYDDSNLTYDDVNVFYDGYNLSQYTNILKPNAGSYILAGTATGLLMSPTYPEDILINDPYTYVAKPN